MITGMGIFIGCGYGSHMGIDAATLVLMVFVTGEADPMKYVTS
jgi:hypothetical protein